MEEKRKETKAASRKQKGPLRARNIKTTIVGLEAPSWAGIFTVSFSLSIFSLLTRAEPATLSPVSFHWRQGGERRGLAARH